MTLREYNEKCVEIFKNLGDNELLEKYVFGEEECELLLQQLSILLGRQLKYGIVAQYKELVTMLMVSFAKYYYVNDGGIWGNFVKYFDCDNKNVEVIYRCVENTYDIYKTNYFDDYHLGYKRLALIIIHAGMPTKMYDSFVKYFFEECYNDIINYHAIEVVIDKIDLLGEKMQYQAKVVKNYLMCLSDNDKLFDYINNLLFFLNNYDSIDECYLELDSKMQKALLEGKKQYLMMRNGFTRNTSPALKMNKESGLFIVETPSLFFNEAVAVWHIDNGRNIIKRRIYSDKSTNYYLRSENVVIDDFDTINLVLKNDKGDCEYSNYKVLGDERFIVFDLSGDRNSRGIINQEGGYVCISKKYKPTKAATLVFEKENFNIWCFENILDDELIFDNCLQETLTVKVKRKVELYDGIKWLDGYAAFDFITPYCELPKITIPHNTKWEIEINKERKIIAELDRDVDLGDYIAKDAYGQYNIRLKSSIYGSRYFNIAYFPKVEFDRVKKLAEHKIKIIFAVDNNEIKILSNGQQNSEFILEDSEKYFYGELHLRDQIYKFRIILHAIDWRVESNKEELNLENKFIEISTKDIPKDNTTILVVENHVPKDVYLKMVDGEKLIKFFKIKGNQKLILSLREYIEIFNNSENNVQIYLEEDFNKLIDLCVIKKEFCVKRLRRTFFGDEVKLSWEDEGINKNLQLCIRNLDNFNSYKIVDITPIKEGIQYSFYFKKEEFYDNCIIEIFIKEKSFGKKKNHDLIKKDNSLIISHSDTLYLTNNCNNCVLNFVNLYCNQELFSSFVNYKNVLSNLMDNIRSLRLNKGDVEVLKKINCLDLDQKVYNELIREFGMYYPINLKKELSEDDWKMLKKNNDALYLIYICVLFEQDRLIEIFQNKYFDILKDEECYQLLKVHDIFEKSQVDNIFVDNKQYCLDSMVQSVIFALLNSTGFQNVKMLYDVEQCSIYIANLIKKSKKTFLEKVSDCRQKSYLHLSEYDFFVFI